MDNRTASTAVERLADKLEKPEVCDERNLSFQSCASQDMLSLFDGLAFASLGLGAVSC